MSNEGFPVHQLLCSEGSEIIKSVMNIHCSVQLNALMAAHNARIKAFKGQFNTSQFPFAVILEYYAAHAQIPFELRNKNNESMVENLNMQLAVVCDHTYLNGNSTPNIPDFYKAMETMWDAFLPAQCHLLAVTVPKAHILVSLKQ